MLHGKDDFEVDRAFVAEVAKVVRGCRPWENTHQVAQRADPEARVVYVDNDPMVPAHGRALLAESEHTAVVTSDLRDPAAILGDEAVKRLIDGAQRGPAAHVRRHRAQALIGPCPRGDGRGQDNWQVATGVNPLAGSSPTALA